MASAATVVRRGRLPTRPRSSRLLAAGRTTTAAAIAALLLLQWINHDWFPPEISVSQYGVGPRGWVFSCWTALLAASMLALTAGGPELGARTRFVYYWVIAGSAGLVVMGVVRTDAGGAQHSWHAKMHMAGSILALVTLPVAIVLALSWAARPWRRTAVALTVVSAAALLLVLLSAFGTSTPGMDAQHSWAFWQAVAVVADMALVAVFALAGVSGRDAGTTRAGPG